MAAIFRRSCFSLSALAAAALLAACGNFVSWIPPGLGLNRLMAVPQPFKATVKTMDLASSADPANDISLTDIAGLPREDREALGAALTRALDRYDILLQPHLTERRTSLLEGSAGLEPVPGGRQVSLAFNLRRPDGTLDAQFAVRAMDPGSSGGLSADSVGAIAADAARQIAAAKGRPSASAGNVPRQRPRVFLAGVTGAPGDGNKALATAMSAVLAGDGIDVTADRARATHTLAGKVTMAETTDPGTETIAIAWQVLDPAGRVLAEIAQSNGIPKGSLAHAWGETAYDVAQAASEGLIAALEQMAQPGK